MALPVAACTASLAWAGSRLVAPACSLRRRSCTSTGSWLSWPYASSPAPTAAYQGLRASSRATLPCSRTVSPYLRTSSVMGTDISSGKVERRSGRGDRSVVRLVGPLDRGAGRVLPAEGLVDLQQHLLLPLGEPGVAQDGAGDGVVTDALVEDAGVHIQLLGGDAQRLGDLLQDLRGRLAQPTLDL